ncbi:MAG TPA: apolipoprotein N-acyltransferase [Usitatibacter sp.]|nr:apolipoprotein N-acyltransferase [Usitatibacter sp.]
MLPLAAGASSVFAFAPFYAWPVEILALAVLFAVWSAAGSARQAWLSGYAFGLGCFLAGVSWIFVSLYEFGAMPAILAAIATFAFCAYLALFPAFAGWIAARLGAASPARRIALAAPSFVALEWLRGTLFTGFPWLGVGTSQAPASPLAGFAPWLGAYGVSLAVCAAASLLAALALARGRARVRFPLAIALAVLFLAGGLARLPEWTGPAGAPVRIALLQGNVAQEIKWLEERRTRTLLEYRRMILAAPARVVIVPETALPAFLDQLPPDYMQGILAQARSSGKDILLGTVERIVRDGSYDYYNSLVRITGDPRESYRKRHLVPFGEFVPPGFAWALHILHIPMSDFSRGTSTQAPLEAGGVRFGVAICYEDMFGEELIDQLPAAQVLVNVSDDTWFGHSLEPEQHLQASQMRALETGRWMVRATNTGVTAAVDERGRVVSRLPGFTQGTLLADVVPRNGMTPYARTGNLPTLAIVAAGLFVLRRRRVGD